MKIVLDCKVLISAGLSDGNCRKALREALNNHTLYLSKEILREYTTVIARPKFKDAQGYLYSLIETICKVSELVELARSDFILPDKNDLIYLDTALTSSAQYLVTGNIKDFPQGSYKSCRIITPKDVLTILEKDKGL